MAASGFGVFAPSNFGRVDQGVDFGGHGNIPALDAGVVTDVGTAHIIEGGTYPYVIYRLTHGPFKGRYVYVAENFAVAPGIQVGTKLRQGDVLGFATGNSPYIEVGFNQTAQGWDAYGSPSDRNSPQGELMLRYIQGLIGVAKVQDPNTGGDPTGLTALPGVGGVVGTVHSIGDFLGLITTGAFWLRALEVIGGGLMILIGMYLLAKQIGLSEPAIPQTLKNAANDLPTVEPSSNPTGRRPARTRVVNQYYLEEPPSTRRKRLAAQSTYDPETAEIPFG